MLLASMNLGQRISDKLSLFAVCLSAVPLSLYSNLQMTLIDSQRSKNVQSMDIKLDLLVASRNFMPFYDTVVCFFAGALFEYSNDLVCVPTEQCLH